MKTDMERVKELLDSLGVRYFLDDANSLSVSVGGIVGGNLGCYTEFLFDDEGKFQKVRIFK